MSYSPRLQQAQYVRERGNMVVNMFQHVQAHDPINAGVGQRAMTKIELKQGYSLKLVRQLSERLLNVIGTHYGSTRHLDGQFLQKKT
jgi:hypothetical protein